MINRNKLYKNNGKQQVNEASFNSMSQEKQPASPPIRPSPPVTGNMCQTGIHATAGYYVKIGY